MMEEQYVDFETAKLLKNKGFDEPCQFLYFAKYNTNGDFRGNFHPSKNSEINEASYSAPTQQMAMRWLREVHELLISINPTMDKDGFLCVTYYIWNLNTEEDAIRSDVYSMDSYEECVEAAIKYCLEHLI